MKAVVFHGIGDIRIDTVSDPEVADVADAVDAYRAFDVREPGWMKVTLTPRRCEPERGGL
ncbi:hypothetical protein QZM18_24395 [Burkholderia diffusa]|uniref:hypothetical protein n=1 Tax=Burkholderia diffusa TaxID=488732 RepID=UPI002655240E|nr:hypothetical protein [Burkholderia diffusa]MDN7907236.1 hypothetical protein [Burkholderia diffusa]